MKIIETRRAHTLLAAALLLGAAGCSKGPADEPDMIEPEQTECQRDAQSEAASAVARAGEGGTGYICPVQDQDWWSYTMPASDRILEISLGLSAPLSPVEPSYSIWSSDGGEAGELLASPRATEIGAMFDDVHCVEPGELLIQVSDSGDDAQDLRHAYTLQVSSRPDPDGGEPNDTLDDAVALSSGQAEQGYIACAGDEDYFSFEVPEGNLVRVELTSEIAGYEPTLELYNEAGDLLVDDGNPRGPLEATAIDRFEVLQGAGRYHVVIKDDDGEDADPGVPYSLLVEFINDDDPNEPNNHPRDATPIAQSAQGCGQASQEFTFQGTIGSPNDQDWFRLPLDANCVGAILDAKVEIDQQGVSVEDRWELQDDLQVALSMVRPHADSPCEQDSSCNTLQLSCSNANQCAGYFETCLPEQLCAGATVCLPEGVCGANQVLRRYDCNPAVAECRPSAEPPPEMRAELSAPLLSQDVVYLRVSDYQADAGAPDLRYTLRVKVRPETDTREPSNLFTNQIDRDLATSSAHSGFATEVPVHDCTAGDCCDGSTWIEGTLGYENDLDWFSYQHPCPGQDCMMRLHYELDAGPVDMILQLFRGQQRWFDALEIEEEEMQAGVSGTLGGLTAQDTCYYAFQGHTGDPFRYYVLVRDVFETYEDLNITIPSSRDWDPNQRYRFCVEKIANECVEPPCQIYTEGPTPGCGQPMQ